MSTSQKHADFVRESMKGKGIDTIAGIGPSAAAVFKEKGFEQASHLLGQYLVLGQDETIFTSWLETEISSGNTMNGKHRGDVYNCLKEWCDKNL